MIDFFQTLNVKRFVFADGDNVNNPKVFIDFLNDRKLLELNTQIICFIGANTNQNTWYNTAVKYIQSLNKQSFNMTPIRILTEGSNALDMVLSSYVGLAMGQNPRAEFIIVSNDKGYGSVIEHFGSLGILINRISVNNTNSSSNEVTPKNIKKSTNINQKQINEIIASLLLIKRTSRPKKISTLKNAMMNNLIKTVTKENCDLYIEAVIDELIKKKKITLNDQTITWK